MSELESYVGFSKMNVASVVRKKTGYGSPFTLNHFIQIST